jgi:ankyrin repeat protein
MSPALIILLAVAVTVLGAIILSRIRMREADPLLRALQQRNHHRAHGLIEAGANVNVIGKTNTTPLMCAATQGQLLIVEALVQHGARLNDGAIPALMKAAEGGHADIVEFLLRSGADVNATTTHGGVTAIEFAAEKGNAEVVKLLISARAFVNDADKLGLVLYHAVRRGHVEVADLLLRAGANANRRVVGRTALMNCAVAADICQQANGERNYALAKQLMELLLAAGADPKAEADGGGNVLSSFVNAAGSRVPGKKENEDALLQIVRTLVAAGVDTSRSRDGLQHWGNRSQPRPIIAKRFFKELEDALVGPKQP